MPVYLCKPGSVWNTEDQGVPVYYEPFCLQDPIRYADDREQYDSHAATRNDSTTAHITSSASQSGDDGGGNTTLGRDMVDGTRENPSPPRNTNTNGEPTTNNDAAEGDRYNRGRGPYPQFVQPHGNGHSTQYDVNGRATNPPQQRGRGGAIGNEYNDINPIGTNTSDSTSQQQRQRRFIETPVMRRVRHAEVVLVDRVSFRYQCYWLRLKWPGPQGGFAGYIALPAGVPPEEELGLKNFDRCMLTSEQEDVRHGENEENEEMGEEKGDDERRMEDAVSHNNEDTLQPSERSPPEGFDHHVENEQFFPLEQQTTDTDGASATTGQASQSNSITSNNDGSNRNIITYPLRPRCDSTGIYYPSSHEVELLTAYDDGLTALISSSDADSLEGDSGGLEKVICRICREGLHDIDYDGSIQGGEEAAAIPGGNRNDGGNGNAAGIDGNLEIQQPVVNELVQGHNPVHTPAQVLPPREQGTHTNISNSPNTATISTSTMKHPYAQNPLLSPCDCSGSMAFVHYLCIEQWRCRSRHPAARSGSHCETCRTPYTLPPRPTPVHSHRGGGDPDDPNNDILEGMPPHVLQALRNPHVGWRIGSNLVRRRYLRPLAPILISPAVALYCRARRALKKRGVSRRRWACSLCRRRARWKCVRCLRSYYCSRQCQNVSWHIVHKHVCYKPARFGWSMVVYGGLMLWFIPGISEYPLLYDLGLSFLWLSFGCMGILGGGVATALKRGLGLDIRGRTLEGIVVGLTIAFAGMLWGLIWGFFVGEEQCWGVADQFGWGHKSSPATNLSQSTYTPSSWHLPHWGWKDIAQQEESKLGPILTVVQNCILHPGKLLIRMLDRILLKLTPRITRWLCMDDQSEPFCLEITRNANPDFISPSRKGGSQCGSDMHLAAYVFLLAFFFFVFGHVWKKREWILGGGRDLRMRGGGRRRRLGRRDNAAGALVIEPDAREGMDAGERHAHHD